jgi:peptidoglycan-associated lipoprotein
MMISREMTRRGLKLGLALTLALAMGACARNADDAAGGARGGLGASGSATPGSAQDFAVNVGDRVFFESDSSELTSAGVATLDKQAQWLTQYSRYSFSVEGHADERGTREYNFALGARRGETVKNYLAAKGVAASRMRSISYGKERPVAVCDNISCWSQNRRAVTVLGGGPTS